MPLRRPAPLSDDLLNPTAPGPVLLGATQGLAAPLRVKNTFIDAPSGLTPAHMKQNFHPMMSAPAGMGGAPGLEPRSGRSTFESSLIAAVAAAQATPAQATAGVATAVASNVAGSTEHFPLSTVPQPPPSAMPTRTFQPPAPLGAAVLAEPFETPLCTPTPNGRYAAANQWAAALSGWGLGLPGQSVEAPPAFAAVEPLGQAPPQLGSGRVEWEPATDGDDSGDSDFDGLQPQEQQGRPPPPGALYPSVGSAMHQSGMCKRCCFFPRGRCSNGYDCAFCHYEHEKRRRKNKKKSKVATGAVPVAVGALMPGAVVPPNSFASAAAATAPQPAAAVAAGRLGPACGTTASNGSAPVEAGSRDAHTAAAGRRAPAATRAEATVSAASLLLQPFITFSPATDDQFCCTATATMASGFLGTSAPQQTQHQQQQQQQQQRQQAAREQQLVDEAQQATTQVCALAPAMMSQGQAALTFAQLQQQQPHLQQHFLPPPMQPAPTLGQAAELRDRTPPAPLGSPKLTGDMDMEVYMASLPMTPWGHW
eukprot:TRINITY_DN3730_c0_g1_i1.p1 TRINITY_DN3730_c0_g1~~TRINITY_DN3730_c0_g1_i1.p1  ORF type:complete len:537 (+),score=127.69 TRINITY_DN3730_c0_g1_i1:104-1714(+)